MSYSEQEKLEAIMELDEAIAKAGLDVGHVRVRVPGHMVLIGLGFVITVFGFLVHRV